MTVMSNIASPDRHRPTASEEAADLLNLFGITVDSGSLECRSPIDGSLLARIAEDDVNDLSAKIAGAASAFLAWRDVPAPRRGELVRLLGDELRRSKSILAQLVTLECGKIVSEAEGEVQEMIDICDFAVGLSRQLHGLAIPSERPDHSIIEAWHPAGVVGVISAFNFPVAVWSWNAALALVCGDAVVWKPSEKTPLTAKAVAAIFARAAEAFGGVPEGLVSVVIGGPTIGTALADDVRVAVVSATGSTRMGRDVAVRVAARFGRSILELGGNNAVVVAPTADLDLAMPTILFGAVGTAGQRCTTTRRLFVHADVYAQLLARLKAAYADLAIGDPREMSTLVGPLIDEAAASAMDLALASAADSGALVTGGERIVRSDGGVYVRPAIVEYRSDDANIYVETFAPILSVFAYTDLGDAIDRNNAVPQGLSSAILTSDLREAGRFTAPSGSDCGIVNVNLGTSGAEIGGAFGGEKDTGGGRESGTDAWRGYMRRQTRTTNYGVRVALAQGVRFDS